MALVKALIHPRRWAAAKRQEMYVTMVEACEHFEEHFGGWSDFSIEGSDDW